jgi:LacI family transcriptional regulator
MKKLPLRPTGLAGCTQADVASVAGVSVQTVSLVLKERPGPSEKTRCAVLAAARLLGYRPDPYLSALSAYRRKGPMRARASLALLLHGWVCERQPEVAKRTFAWARERAELLGFELEQVVVNDTESASFRRILRVLPVF